MLRARPLLAEARFFSTTRLNTRRKATTGSRLGSKLHEEDAPGLIGGEGPQALDSRSSQF